VEAPKKQKARKRATERTKEVKLTQKALILVLLQERGRNRQGKY
jgi:hypothetical protein